MFLIVCFILILIITNFSALFYGMTGLSGNIIIVSVLYYGGTMVANSELSIGALTSFLMYAAYSAISIGGLTSFYTELNKSIGSATRIWEIMDRKFEIPNVGLIPAMQPQGLIEFKNVDFSYPTRDNARILKDFTLTLKNGTRTAIVGRSGSGKSTIASLLLRQVFLLTCKMNALKIFHFPDFTTQTRAL